MDETEFLKGLIDRCVEISGIKGGETPYNTIYLQQQIGIHNGYAEIIFQVKAPIGKHPNDQIERNMSLGVQVEDGMIHILVRNFYFAEKRGE